LPAAEREVLEQLKAGFRSGALKTPRRTLARSISQNLRRLGVCEIGHHGVEAWLQRS
jgi:inactivated superfamily I helicase